MPLTAAADAGTALATWVPVLVGLFALAALAASIAAYLRATYLKATVEVQSQNNKALLERVAILEDALERALTTSGAHERENSVLREALSGKADIAALTLLIEEHHNRAMDGVAKMLDAQRDVLNMLADRRGGVT